MANNIAKFKTYIDLLDEVYKTASVTDQLDGNLDLVREGNSAEEMVIPVMQLDGLGDYSRSTGYPTGDVTISYETKKCNYDRGKKFIVDAMDNTETAGIAFGRLASEFLRTKVVPEVDAFRFATYASKAGTNVSADLADGDAWVKALSAATVKLDDSEVTSDNRHLFITSAGREAIDNLDVTKSRAVLSHFIDITVVPAGRFNSAIELGENGFTVSASGKAINFMVIAGDATIQYPKHIVSKVFSPEENQNADAWVFPFREYGICEVYDSKKNGIYVHTVA